MAFPRQLKWVTLGLGNMEVFVRKTGENEKQSRFFADNEYEWSMLFVPVVPEDYEGELSGLDSRANPESVAKHIRRLVKEWTGLESLERVSREPAGATAPGGTD